MEYRVLNFEFKKSFSVYRIQAHLQNAPLEPGRCAAKGILLRGVAFGFPLRGHFHLQRWLWGLEAMEMAAQAGNNVYFDLFRFFSIFFLFILL